MSSKPGFIYETLSEEWKPVKPCPFCGTIDIAVLSLESEVIIGCTNCGAHGPTWDFRIERAIQSWNDRADIPGNG
jgi:Lar family restriction alleviation protein